MSHRINNLADRCIDRGRACKSPATRGADHTSRHVLEGLRPIQADEASKYSFIRKNSAIFIKHVPYISRLGDSRVPRRHVRDVMKLRVHQGPDVRTIRAERFKTEIDNQVRVLILQRTADNRKALIAFVNRVGRVTVVLVIVAVTPQGQQAIRTDNRAEIQFEITDLIA